MRRREPTSEEQAVLERFERADGVVHHVIWAFDPGEVVDEALWRRVATATLAEVIREGFYGEQPGEVQPPASCERIDREHLLHQYRRAVEDPPYRLAGDDPEELYAELVRVVLRGVPAGAVIYSWSDEHPIFRSGREWWGTFFFTVSVPGGAVGIVASETD